MSFSPTCFFTHLQISPTCRFHLLVDLIARPDFCQGPSSPLLKISPTCRFHQIMKPDFTQSSLTFVRFHQLADFTNFQISPSHHLQISPTCRFRLLVDFNCLHLSCVMTEALMISFVCIHLPVILTHCFLSPAVPQK